MFAPSRIRGPYGTHMTAEVALKAGRTLGDRHEAVALGHDPRENARLLADAVATGIREAGGTVYRLGTVASPAVSTAVRQLDADSGIAVTAAPDPSEDVGLKLFDSDGSRLSWERQRHLVRRVNGTTADLASWDSIGTEQWLEDAAKDYIERLCDGQSSFDEMHVVVDVGEHRVGNVAETLERLECTVDRVTESSSDAFPRRRVAQNDSVCSTLCNAVATSAADFGVAHDPDADRIVAIDERGHVVGGDTLLALLAKRAVEQSDGSGRVAVPLEASRRIEEVVDDAGGEIVRTQMDGIPGSGPASTTEVVFGGEPSGVHHWPDESPCPDAALSAIRLARLVDDGPSLSRQVQRIDDYSLYFESFSVDKSTRAMSRITDAARNQFEDVQTDDGLFVEDDEAWFVVRPSRTAGELRVTVEGTSDRHAKRLFERVAGLVCTGKSTAVV
ncbi:phosphohexomutase domain-containing protein [Haloferax larsenii]|uniref:Phosphoglucosamine mutase n=1 Tax=Haloferax larsenii TaxID=302484 RepID=A0A1H7V3Q3_HALLR|nr:phosphoglucosamine mutase [Haloferax larsenii]SEM03744.1 phosphoglucosamine mutase [Haloferax larsenii]